MNSLPIEQHLTCPMSFDVFVLSIKLKYNSSELGTTHDTSQ